MKGNPLYRVFLGLGKFRYWIPWGVFPTVRVAAAARENYQVEKWHPKRKTRRLEVGRRAKSLGLRRQITRGKLDCWKWTVQSFQDREKSRPLGPSSPFSLILLSRLLFFLHLFSLFPPSPENDIKLIIVRKMWIKSWGGNRESSCQTASVNWSGRSRNGTLGENWYGKSAGWPAGRESKWLRGENTEAH